MSNFFKNKKDKSFFNDFIPLQPQSYTIIIVFLNGNSVEKRCVTNPWAFMNELKKNPKIKTCYIKDEKNAI